MTKEKRYDFHSEHCPAFCSLGLTRDELKEDFELDEETMKKVDALKNEECIDYFYNTIYREDVNV